jgi:hypothetical protein
MISAASCSRSAPEKTEAPAARPVVVLSIWDGPPESPRAPIQGSVACIDRPLFDPLCMEDDGRLAEAVLQCGSLEVTIDRGSSHVRHVHFPAGLHERFDAIPADLDIVRCVRGQIGFRFAAGIARDRSSLEGADRRPFESLHAPEP